MLEWIVNSGFWALAGFIFGVGFGVYYYERRLKILGPIEGTHMLQKKKLWSCLAKMMMSPGVCINSYCPYFDVDMSGETHDEYHTRRRKEGSE